MDMFKRIASVWCAALVALVGVAPTAGGAARQPEDDDRRVSSTVTIRYNRDTHKFKGQVISHFSCGKYRKVLVKKHRPGKNLTVGTDTTNRRKVWKIHRQAQPGRYYAVVKPKTITDSNGVERRCGWDRSPTINIF